MKPNILRALALAAIAVLVIGSDAFAQKVTVSDIVYKINKKKGTAELDKGTEAKGHIVIPETVTFEGKDYKVTSIGRNAFCCTTGKDRRNHNLTGVIIPNTVTNIGGHAFMGCVSLKEAVIPNSVKEMGFEVFGWCTTLRSVVVPDQEPIRKDRGLCYSTFNGSEAIVSVRGNTVDFPMYVYNCDTRGKHNEIGGWLDNDCPFMKFKYPKLEANGFGFYNETIAEPDVAQNNVTAQDNDGNVSSLKAATTPQSDVDKNIPQNTISNENTFAVIIANENYQDVSKVPNAINDGVVFAEYCKKSLGLPTTNVRLVKDATLNNIRREIDWLKNVAQVYKGEAKIMIYYAGHGIPDEATQTSYLLPVDGLGNNVNSGISLKDFYKTLSDIPSKSVVVFLDACFSGATRDGSMMASARGVAIKAKAETPQGKLVVFSAAQGDETAYPYMENGHGMFTYYLLKKIQETGGDVTLGDLAEFVKDNVAKKSIVINGKLQTPTVSSSVTLGEEWKTWKLK